MAAHPFFHEYPDGPAQQYFNIIGTGKIHAQHEYQVGKTIEQRAANSEYPGLVNGNGNITQHGNGRPTDDIAEKDDCDTQLYAQRRVGL